MAAKKGKPKKKADDGTLRSAVEEAGTWADAFGVMLEHLEVDGHEVDLSVDMYDPDNDCDEEDE